MATLLLVVIYIAFIGLGVPDSLFGTAWPAIYQEFGVNISYASFVTLTISGCTVVSSLASARVLKRFGTPLVTAVSTSMTAAALLGFSCAQSHGGVSGMVFLCLLAVPLGLGAGSVDTALNNYVALHYKATHMNFLHCFYGIGVSLSPWLMSLALGTDNDWRSGYRYAFLLQLVIALITAASIPLWKKAHGPQAEAQGEEAARLLPLREMARRPDIRSVWFIFIGSCALEYTCGSWGSTFLVQSKGMTAGDAAKIITFYYAGMALGRFLSGVLSSRLSGWILIRLGQGIVLTAIALTVLPLPSLAAAAGLFLIGLGNGPIFPNLIHLTPRNFGRDLSWSVMGTQMAASYIGIMLMPPIFGILAQVFGTGLFPYYLLAMYFVMDLATYSLLHRLKKNRPADMP